MIRDAVAIERMVRDVDGDKLSQGQEAFARVSQLVDVPPHAFREQATKLGLETLGMVFERSQPAPHGDDAR